MQPGPSLVRQISVRLVAAAVLVSVFEIIGVLALYASNRPKLALELVTAQADRVFDALTAADAHRSLSELAAPRGAADWTFIVHDSSRKLIFEHAPKNSAQFQALPEPKVEWPSGRRRSITEKVKWVS